MTSEPVEASSGARRLPPWEWLFVVIALSMGGVLMLTLPPFSTPDERAHLLRVSTMAHGWLLPPLTKDSIPEYRIDGCTASLFYTQTFKPATTWSDRFSVLECSDSMEARSKLPVIRRAEAYTPVPYAPAVLGFRGGRVVAGTIGSFYGARIAQLLTYVALIAAAIRISPFGKPLLFAVALLPVTLQSAVGISADPITLALAVLFVASTLWLIERGRRRAAPATTVVLATFGALALALSMSKTTYFPMVAVILLIPTATFGNWKRRLAWVGGIIGVVVGAVLAWGIAVVSQINTASDKNADSTALTSDALHDPFGFLQQVWTSWTETNAVTPMLKGLVVPHYRLAQRPTVAIAVAIVIIVGLLVVRLMDPPLRVLTDDDAESDHEELAVQAAALPRIASWTLVVGAAVGSFWLMELGLVTVASFDKSGYLTGFQGRYLLPLIPLSLVGAIPRAGSRVADGLRVAVPVASLALLVWWSVVSWRHYNTHF